MTVIGVNTNLTEGCPIERLAAITHNGQASWAVSRELQCKTCAFAIPMGRNKIRCRKTAEFTAGRSKIQFPDSAYACRFYEAAAQNAQTTQESA